MTPRTLNNQQGIAIGPILFIIAILAIIAAAIAAGSGAFNDNTNTESNKSIAQSMVNYAGQLHNAMDMVLQNGCLDTQIQWWQLPNPNSPLDGSCSIFDPRGGGILNRDFSVLSGALNTSQATLYSNWDQTYGHFSAFGSMQVVGVGSNAPLMFALADVSPSVCKEINKITGYSASNNYAPPSLSFAFDWVFQGVYSNTTSRDLGFTTYNVQEGCLYDPYWPTYFYFGVLLAR